MKRKSTPAFVLALIAGIAAIIVGLYTVWISIVAVAFGGKQFELLLILGWVSAIGGVAGIVGACFCFKRANIGAIILSIVTVLSGGSLVGSFAKILFTSSADAGTLIILGAVTLIPTAMFILATICAFRAKGKMTQSEEQFVPQNLTPKSTEQNVEENMK